MFSCWAVVSRVDVVINRYYFPIWIIVNTTSGVYGIAADNPFSNCANLSANGEPTLSNLGGVAVMMPIFWLDSAPGAQINVDKAKFPACSADNRKGLEHSPWIYIQIPAAVQQADTTSQHDMVLVCLNKCRIYVYRGITENVRSVNNPTLLPSLFERFAHFFSIR